MEKVKKESNQKVVPEKAKKRKSLVMFTTALLFHFYLCTYVQDDFELYVGVAPPRKSSHMVKYPRFCCCLAFLYHVYFNITTGIPYRTKVWQEKSLANLPKLGKSPNFFCQIFGFQKQNFQIASYVS